MLSLSLALADFLVQVSTKLAEDHALVHWFMVVVGHHCHPKTI
jgi:hypothetical protein